MNASCRETPVLECTQLLYAKQAIGRILIHFRSDLSRMSPQNSWQSAQKVFNQIWLGEYDGVCVFFICSLSISDFHIWFLYSCTWPLLIAAGQPNWQKKLSIITEQTVVTSLLSTRLAQKVWLITLDWWLYNARYPPEEGGQLNRCKQASIWHHQLNSNP